MRRFALPVFVGLVTLALLACTQLTVGSQAVAASMTGESNPSRQLMFFHPQNSGVLSQCKNAHMSEYFERASHVNPSEPGRSWVVQGPYRVNWNGGWFHHSDSDPQPAAGHGWSLPLTDVCFVITVRGLPLVSGAVVSDYSARLLDFPTLVRTRNETSGVLVFELRPRFPGRSDDQIPADWGLLFQD